MIGDGAAQYYLLIVTDAKSALGLGQTFVEPIRPIADRVVHQQMRVLVKYNAERILFAASFSRQRDVVDVIAGLKIAGCVCVWLEGFIRAAAFEDDDRR